MSTALEVMQAIVENGGPKEMWVSHDNEQWWKAIPTMIDIHNEEHHYYAGRWYKFASLTDPNEKDEREVCPNCGKKAWKTFVPAPHSRPWGNVSCSNCKKPWPEPIADPKTRPMTAQEDDEADLEGVEV